MLVPQLVLAFMAIISGWFLWKPMIAGAQPLDQVSGIQSFAFLGEKGNPGMHAAHVWLLHGAGWILPVLLGWWLYKDGLGRAAAIARLRIVRPVHEVLLNKFYFDVVYDRLIAGACVAKAKALDWVDQKLIDQAVNATANRGVDLADAAGVVDRVLVDRSIGRAADAVYQAGGILRTTQPGRVRVYVIGVFLAVLLILITILAAFLPIWEPAVLSAVGPEPAAMPADSALPLTTNHEEAIRP